MFRKLIKRDADLFVIRFLVQCLWYSNKTFCVRWGGTTTSFFTVVNGVHQGGIMSPILFNIYMDELNCELNRCNIGCSLNGTLINHIMYADDTCIIASSPSALQRLLNICLDFADSNFVFCIFGFVYLAIKHSTKIITYIQYKICRG